MAGSSFGFLKIHPPHLNSLSLGERAGVRAENSPRKKITIRKIPDHTHQRHQQGLENNYNFPDTKAPSNTSDLGSPLLAFKKSPRNPKPPTPKHKQLKPCGSVLRFALVQNIVPVAKRLLLAKFP